MFVRIFFFFFSFSVGHLLLLLQHNLLKQHLNNGNLVQLLLFSIMILILFYYYFFVFLYIYIIFVCEVFFFPVTNTFVSTFIVSCIICLYNCYIFHEIHSKNDRFDILLIEIRSDMI